MARFYKNLALFAFVAFLALFYKVDDARAQAINYTPSPPAGTPAELSGCATDTWTAMVNQAVMQTRREDLLNKRFIIKSDSVLQYSCFGRAIVNTAENLGPIFTETDRWANVEVDLYGDKTQMALNPGLSALDAALFSVVETAAQSYINTQFSHPFLMGKAPVATNGQLLCVTMSEIWQASKCDHFDDTDVFYSFEELVVNDPRDNPPVLTCN